MTIVKSIRDGFLLRESAVLLGDVVVMHEFDGEKAL